MISEKKKFVIKGFVEVEVFAEIEAKNLSEAKRIVKKQEETYGKGNGLNFNYEEGNWCSSVTIEEIVEK